MILEIEKFSVENTEVLDENYPYECTEFFFKSRKISLIHLISVKTGKKLILSLQTDSQALVV